MEKIATDTYSFERLREDGYVYVDKTDVLLPIANGSIGTQFFIARPRRFGKSLTVATLQCLFEGRRELFKGLAIENQWDWSKKWPVIHLDMGSAQVDDISMFEGRMQFMLRLEAKRHGLTLPDGMDATSQFAWMINALATHAEQGKVVLLIDEYDKPLLGLLGHPEIESVRSRLKQFYSVIKTYEGLQRFAFITGVSKFSKVSIFSDLNNLNDFSMDARVARLFGYTHDEVKANFPAALKALGSKLGLDDAGTFAELVKWYDGYRFHQDAERVFNPVSVGKCLSSGEINAYWFETGTPTFLIKLMAEHPIELDNVEVSYSAFSVYEPASPALMPLLYQTGYLTIVGDHWDGGTHIYKLGVPNFEVSTSLSESLVKEFSALPDFEQSSFLNQILKALRADDVNDMLDSLSCFFANMPANITLKNEKYYQSLFYAVFILIGARTQAECWTNRGRIDAMVETPCGIYVFEFKLSDKPGRPVNAAAALAQIKANGYAEKYARAGKKLTLVGVAFDATERNLADRAIEVITG